MDKNIFHGRFETGLKDDFIMYYLLTAANLESCQLFLSTGAINLSQFRTTYCPTKNRPLCFKKITTITTAFLIFNTVGPNPYNHGKHYRPCLCKRSVSDHYWMIYQWYTLLIFLNPWLIAEMWPVYIFSIGITLVDVL